MASFEILDPTVEPRKQPLTYVPRPDSLRGKRIGLIENTKFNSDNLLVSASTTRASPLTRRSSRSSGRPAT